MHAIFLADYAVTLFASMTLLGLGSSAFFVWQIRYELAQPRREWDKIVMAGVAIPASFLSAFGAMIALASFW